jgi:class 3 adenylate cyclase
VLATAGVREAIEEEARDGFAWSSVGRRKIKGLNDPLTLYRVRRAEESDGSRRRKGSD